jgi:hypothetical protein
MMLMILYQTFQFQYGDVLTLQLTDLKLHENVLDLIQDGCYLLDEVLDLMKSDAKSSSHKL